MIYIESIIGIIILITWYFVQKKLILKIILSKSDSRMKDILSRGTGKFGIIEKKSYMVDTPFFIEMEELEEAGQYTKIKLIKIIKPEGCDRADSELLRSISYREWVLTSSIIWYTNNSQRLRESKIDEILEKAQVQI